MELHRSGTIRRSLIVAALAVGFLAPAPIHAAPETYAIDKEHTAVTFKIKHFFSKVPGRFTTFEGTIDLDRDDWSASAVNVTIDTASIDTDEAARDRHLRSDAFFDAENHPTITFRSTSAEANGTDKLAIHGDLTMRGITRPVTLDVDVLGFGKMYGVERAAFEARTTINRMDFDVSWNDVVEGGGLILGKDVEIVINLEAKKQKKKAAGN
jgi:polyisoprenoid-binding protein YceI